MSTQMKKYQPGDRVIVREDLKDGEQYCMSDNKAYAANAVYAMTRFAGQAVTIRGFFSGRYLIEEDSGWVWTDEMFVGLEEEPEMFDVEDLI